MSSNLEIPHLNTAGQVTLAAAASILVNGVVHPLHTLKSHLQAGHSRAGQLPRGQSVTLLHRAKALYKGVGAMSLVDFGAFGVAYAINGAFSDIPQPGPSILAGFVSAPVAAVGEGLAINRQVNAMSYSQGLKMSMRSAGFTATILRDCPYPCLMLYIAPSLQRQIEEQLPSQSPIAGIAIQAVAGGVVGGLGGLATAPFDLLKTRVQASATPLSITAVTKEVAKGGVRAFFRGGGARTFYTGAFGVGINIVNNIVPHYFPPVLRVEKM